MSDIVTHAPAEDLSSQSRPGAAQRSRAGVGDRTADRYLGSIVDRRANGRGRPPQREHRGGGGATECETPEDRRGNADVATGEEQNRRPRDLARAEAELMGVEGDDERERREPDRHERQRDG